MSDSKIAKFIIFQIGNMKMIVQMNIPKEIIRFMAPTKLPESRPHIVGVIKPRDVVITVVDMGVLMGVKTEISDSSRIIVYDAECNNRITPIGFLVDAVHDTAEIADADFEPAPSVVGEAQFVEIAMVAKRGEEILQLVDLRDISRRLCV